jgi:CubicO group peptidase (beta-lactamase class C family)
VKAASILPNTVMVTSRLGLITPLLLLGACVVRQPSPKDSTPPPAAAAQSAEAPDALLIQTLDEKAPAWLAEFSVPSVTIAYIKDGAVQWTRAYGQQSEGVPATPRTLYNVASLAKPVFAEVVLRLVADGRLSLDEPLSSHWVDPDVAADPRHHKLTLRIALSHRTGFPNWSSRDQGGLRFFSEPGSVLGYSGEGYEYARRFVERKLGASLESLARRYVLAPLGMTSTAFTRQDWFADRVALPNGPEGRYGEPVFQTAANAADDLYTTAGDYAAFVVGVMNRRALPAAYADQRDSLHAVNVGATQSCDSTAASYCPRRIGMGLGWEILELPDGTARLHTGGDWGESTMAFYFPERRAGAVIFTNGARGMKVILGIIDILFHETDFARLAMSKR